MAAIAVLVLGLPVAFALCAWFAPLPTFAALVPVDGGVARRRGIAFGADRRQRLDVYAPRAKGPPRAVIVFFYGGSWHKGERVYYGWAARALAARGFVVVVPDYRLVPRVRFPAFLQDCAAAVRWARANAAHHGGDGSRIVLIGHSAGAYNGAMLALDPRWLGGDREAVRGFIGLAGPYDFLPLDGPVTIAAFGQWPRPGETQPIAFAGVKAPPALLLHGGADETVAPRNSERLAAKLAAAGGDARAALYPGISHVGIMRAIARPFRKQAPVLDDIAAFARRVTQAG